MASLYTLPHGVHSVAAGGREFTPDENNQVDLGDIDGLTLQHLVTYAGIRAVRCKEEIDAEMAVEAEMARHRALIAAAQAEADAAHQATEAARTLAAEKARTDAAVASEQSQADRAQNAADVAAADVTVVTPPEPADGTEAAEPAPVPARGVVPPARAKKK